MDNRTVAECMDFNVLVDSFASPHSLLCVSSQLSDHSMATSGNRYVKLQDYYFSVCGVYFAVQVNSKDAWKRSARTFLNEPNFVDTDVISPACVGRSLTFRHRASCILGQAFRCSPENAFYIFNQQIYFII